MEIHICPILMRTVKFENGKCAEQCDEEACPVMSMLGREVEETE